jgi:hypothetical protein
MANEKAHYELGTSDAGTGYDHKDAADIVASRGNHIGEAADIYGDVQTAEEYGYVSRGYALYFSIANEGTLTHFTAVSSLVTFNSLLLVVPSVQVSSWESVPHSPMPALFPSFLVTA